MAKPSPNNTAAADKLDIEPRSNNWRQACEWRAARILRFADRQKKQREWIQFSELAERYGRNIGIAEGYEQLKRAVIAGEFERDGRCRVLYLHPAVTAAKMTREKMRNAVETFPPETVQRYYLACCWIPRELAHEWHQSWSRPGHSGISRPDVPNARNDSLPTPLPSHHPDEMGTKPLACWKLSDERPQGRESHYACFILKQLWPKGPPLSMSIKKIMEEMAKYEDTNPGTKHRGGFSYSTVHRLLTR